MAVIHRTTLVPTKLELLSAWLPTQNWFHGGAEPALSRAGGFRLDDPDGEVGIEVMVVNDDSGAAPMSYLTPLTYRGAPIGGAEGYLIGTTEHGVLGRRWVYDAVYDPVFLDQMLALVVGAVDAQAQDESNALDPSVSLNCSVDGGFVRTDALHFASGAESTDVTGIAASNRAVTLHIVRALHAVDEPHQASSLGEVVASWTTCDEQERRGLFAYLTEE